MAQPTRAARTPPAMPARAPAIPARPSTTGSGRGSNSVVSNSSNTNSNSEIIREELYENMRGSCLFGNVQFGAAGLLPTDPPAWSTVTGAAAFDRMSFPVPSGWEWATDWAVDLRHDVDADGWCYAVSFRAREWSGSPAPSHYVRRRIWIRTRRRLSRLATAFSSSSSSISTMAISQQQSITTATTLNNNNNNDDTAAILLLPTRVRGCTLDRQRLEAIDASLKALVSPATVDPVPVYTVEAVLSEMMFDKNRMLAVKLLLPFLDRDGLIAAVFKITHHCNRVELLAALPKDSFLQAYLKQNVVPFSGSTKKSELTT
ncbi:hypothetical protein HK100_007009 [Physocladia obscura]|uniref:Peroxin/Ferlin domain-containing protein n=1 Tax=Physocladia obscura TaxID=109957 RepID=A0AAD5SS11_9FUNG|nr:hypothetical protein HK100_007009 [Physocladia obscura]